MLITKIFSSGITEGYHFDKLKEILDNTILKDNYFLSRLLLYEGYFCPHCLIDVDLEQLLGQ